MKKLDVTLVWEGRRGGEEGRIRGYVSFRAGGREKTGGGEKRGRRGGDMEPWCSHSASLNANESS